MIAEERHSLLTTTVASVLNVPEHEITDDTSPDTVSNWDSVAHLNLVVALEESFNVSFSPEESMEMTSVKLMKMLLDEKLPA